MWLAAAPLPEKLDGPIFALAVDPADGRQVLAGTGRGSIYRSGNGGASWTPARRGLRGAVLALAFDPQRPRTVLAGTRGGGVWRSVDGGLSWQPQAGTEARSVRAFAFARGLTVAGSDQGVLVDRGGAAWTASGLGQVRVDGLAAVTADASGLIAGGDTSGGGEPLPLFGSGDAGRNWATFGSAPDGSPAFGGSTMVATLAIGPPRQDLRPLLLGTNAGLFLSQDRGVTWQQVTGGGALPATDFVAGAFAVNRPDRFYVASDGGGSDRGGLWATADGGAHFTSLAPPLPTVTALAVSADETPTLYVATFRPGDHAVVLWSYRDAGGTPQGAAAGADSPRPGPAAAASRTGGLGALVTGPEAPYLAIGAAALLVVLVAFGAYMRRGHTR